MLDLCQLYVRAVGDSLDIGLFDWRYPDLTPSLSTHILRTRLLGGATSNLLKFIAKWGRAVEERRAWHTLQLQGDLNHVFTDYVERTQSKVVSVLDYVTLYRTVRRLKPKVVLECGTGLSTTAIATALKHNHTQDGIEGRVISMEHLPQWFEHAKALTPQKLSLYVDLVFSPCVERECQGVRGVAYEQIPEHDYDFVFVDGPEPFLPSQGRKPVYLDFISVAERNPEVHGLIDHRLNTVRHFRPLLAKTHHVVYNPIDQLGYVYPKFEAGGAN